MITTLDKTEWKIDHSPNGLSSLAYPLQRGGKTDYAWVMGPMDRDVAEWLFDAIKRKQDRHCPSKT